MRILMERVQQLQIVSREQTERVKAVADAVTLIQVCVTVGDFARVPKHGADILAVRCTRTACGGDATAGSAPAADVERARGRHGAPLATTGAGHVGPRHD